MATFISDWVKNGGTFTFTVDNVVKAGCIFQAGPNDSATITPSAAPALAESYSNGLENPYPSPGNPEIWVPYTLSRAEHVVIKIYDAAGGLVRALDLGQKASGAYLAKEDAAYWNGRSESGEKVTSGIYFCVMEAGSFSAMKKVIILK